MKTAKTALLVASIVLQAIKLKSNIKDKAKQRQLLQQIIKLLPMNPGQLLQKLQNGVIFETDLNLCEGKIFAGQSLSALLNKNVKVAQSWMIQGSPSSNYRVLKKNQASFLQLKDGSHKVDIFETHNTTVSPTRMLRKVVKNKMIKIKNFFKKPFCSVQQRKNVNITNIFTESEKVYQLYLPEASPCVVLGKFKQEAAGLSCYNPLIMAPNKNALQTQVSNAILKKSLLNVFLVCGIAISAAFLLRQGWKIFKRLKQPSDILQVLSQIQVKSRMCNECGINLCCILAEPCQHLNMCRDCWKDRKICPKCNKTVLSIIELYVC